MIGAADDEGSALVEFTFLAVLLMVPLVYVMLAAFQVQSAAFGVTEAARSAGRAFVLSDDAATARGRAAAAATLALRDQGVEGAAPPAVRCSAGCAMSPGERVTVTVTHVVQLPLLGAVFAGDRAGVRVSGSHTSVVDRFASRDAPTP